MSAILVLALAAASPPCCPEAKPEGKRAARCARVAMEQRCGSVLKTNVSATLRTFCPVACGSCRVCRSAASENASVVLYSRLATAILGSKAHRPFESFSPPAGMSASDFGAVQSGLTRSQLDLVAKVAEHVVERDGWLLEVGSFYGNSASAFARAARQQGSRMPIVCLDTWLGERKMWAKKWPWLQLDKHGTPRLWEQFMTNIIHWLGFLMTTPERWDWPSTLTCRSTQPHTRSLLTVSASITRTREHMCNRPEADTLGESQWAVLAESHAGSQSPASRTRGVSRLARGESVAR